MLDFDEARRRAILRLTRRSARRRRTDAGRSRLAPALIDEVRALVLVPERPAMAEIRRALDDWCRSHGCRPPARATLYNLLATIPGHRYAAGRLPPYVRAALYNLADDVEVPGHQLAFYCFNYGSLAAVSFAAGLPWLDLHQAARLRGWRPRSLGLLRAALRRRGIA